MQQAYLFVHFREKPTPDGEQVHFSVSRDCFHWEQVNQGRPVLWAYYGEKGVRDFTICRHEKTGRFYILATDLSLAYGMRAQYDHSWAEIDKKGSPYFAIWESDDLVHWTEQRLIRIGDEPFGCMWAPDLIFDRESDSYIVHWSSSHRDSGYQPKRIYYSRTADFQNFTAPAILFEQESVIDSAMYEENGFYYLFVKNENRQERVMLLKSERITGPFERMAAFDASMDVLEAGVYEGPTAVRLEDGRWCLFLDYYGVPGAGQGYVPFVADSLASGRFVRYPAVRGENSVWEKDVFSFPYGFKHGTVFTITLEEYERIKNFDWSVG